MGWNGKEQLEEHSRTSQRESRNIKHDTEVLVAVSKDPWAGHL